MATRNNITTQVMSAVTSIAALSASTKYGRPEIGFGVPNATVYVEDDFKRDDMSDMDNSIYELVLKIELRDADNPAPEDNIDTLAASVEAAVLNYTGLTKLLFYGELSSTGFEWSDEGDEDVGLATMTFNFLYDPS